MVPDPVWLSERRDRLVGLVITHAHEDHVGAVAHLWPMLRCPIYAGPFVAAVLRRKLGEAGLAGEAKVITVPLSGSVSLQPFDLQFPRCPFHPGGPGAGHPHPARPVLHTGDFKLDPKPLVGPPRRGGPRQARRGGRAGDGCDSTNAMVEGHSGSEAEVRRNLAADPRVAGRVAVTCFATTSPGWRASPGPARTPGGSVALFGRRLRNARAAARECGYLTGIVPFVPEEEAGSIPDDNLLILITGSQGEPRWPGARSADTPPDRARARAIRSSFPPG